MIKNREKLLESLSTQLNNGKFWDNKLAYLKVILLVPDCTCHNDSPKIEYEFPLTTALDFLINNNNYWDERGNWSEATEIILRVC